MCYAGSRTVGLHMYRSEYLLTLTADSDNILNIYRKIWSGSSTLQNSFQLSPEQV